MVFDNKAVAAVVDADLSHTSEIPSQKCMGTTKHGSGSVVIAPPDRKLYVG